MCRVNSSSVTGFLFMLLAVGAGSTPTPAADDSDVFATKPIVAVAKPDPDSWARLALVDMETFPWDTAPRYRARSKTIFHGPGVGYLVYSIFSPTFTDSMPQAGLGAHYHPYWEWGYTLKGDSALAEPVSPYQLNGMYYRKREGGWLTRPPYSLHGGGWTVGGKRAQLPYHLLIFEEGDGSVVTIGEKGDHFFPDWPDRRPEPHEDWKTVTNWTRPWLVDSQTDLEWEPDRTMEGRFVKWLDDDWEKGFRAMLVKIPPGWTAPAGYKGEYFENANRMRYVVYGDMKVWLFEGPDDSKPRAVSVGEDFFIYQPARSVWGYGSGPVSEIGAIWLEVTYAHGVEHGKGPIEEPVRIH